MMLDLKTTRYYLDCYGTDTTRWPQPEAGKIALAVYKAELGEDLTQASRLDGALGNHHINPPSDLLARRIMSKLPAQKGAPANDIGAKFNWRAVAATLVVLSAVGFTTLNMRAPAFDDTAAETEVWREAALDLGVDDVFDWVHSEDG